MVFFLPLRALLLLFQAELFNGHSRAHHKWSPPVLVLPVDRAILGFANTHVFSGRQDFGSVQLGKAFPTQYFHFSVNCCTKCTDTGVLKRQKRLLTLCCCERTLCVLIVSCFRWCRCVRFCGTMLNTIKVPEWDVVW